ncbi:hypothetical protein NQ318_021718 [Aromia moschata]|uniref:Heme NO-binding domain-containing protein n=1 Tax=Aromia moschata TaxID=1265417 RepID=A0AAV8XYQ8_9CUCU|nr:hypothetical protein NQ318_021718 [Aromia moschata]
MFLIIGQLGFYFQYGFVNYALELLVTKTFGTDTWNLIKKNAEVQMDGQFLVRQIYDDELTYNLISSATELLKIPADTILELFGKTFFEFCQDSGYDKILQVLGATPRDFLQNLDALHDHLGTLYPGMKAPSFRCTERQQDGGLVLHYYSDRPGLEHIVIGIVKVINNYLQHQQRLNGADKLKKTLSKKNIGVRFRTVKKIQQVLPSNKDAVPRLLTKGVYELKCTCGKSYIGQTGRSIQCRIKEYQRHTRLGNTDKSAIAEHVHTNENHKIDYEIRVLDKTKKYYPRIIRESLEIMKNNNNFNRDDGYRLSNTWRLAIPRTRNVMVNRARRMCSQP